MVSLSPQNHLVFDDLFETVLSTDNGALLDDICNCLIDSDHDYNFYEAEFPSDDPLVYGPPPLDVVCHEFEECCCITQDCEKFKWID